MVMKDRLVFVERARTIQILGAYSAETHTVRDQVVMEAGDDAVKIRHAFLLQLDAELDAWEKDIRARIRAAAEATQKVGLPEPVPSREIISELREAATRLGVLTREPVEVARPKTQAEAEVGLKQLRAAIYDLEHKPPQTATEAVQSPAFYGATPQVPEVPAQRVCSNTRKHRPSEPRFIDTEVARFSLERYGRLLCRPCQQSGDFPLGGQA